MVKAVSFGLGALAASLAFGAGWLPGEMRDFEVYWTAGARALDAQPLYRAADGHYQFKYLPAFAILAAPVALLPLAHAKAAWFVASVALLPVLIALGIRLLPDPRRPRWLLALVATAAMAKFYGHELVLGQVNVLFGVLAAAAVLMTVQRRDAAAALLFVGATAVKPYGALFLPWMAYARGRRANVVLAAGVAILLAAPAALYGLEGTIRLHAEWWGTVTGSTAPNLTNNDNVSFAGLFAKWLGPGRPAARLAAAAGGALLALIAIAVWMRRSLREPEALEGALLLIAIPLVSPQGWDYVFLITTPAVILFANYDDRVPAALRWLTWGALAAIGLSLFDVMGRERYAAFMSLSVITLCFVVLVAALVVLRIRRVA